MDTICNGRIQSYYIGERAVNDIVSVWSDYGREYRNKRNSVFKINGIEYKVNLRRKIDIKDGRLQNFFDEYSNGVDYSENQITDPYLIKILQEKRGQPRITNIIKSIQLNQNEIIEYMFDKNLIVQGCAGSGKTMILLHRLANMIYNVPNLDLSKIQIITPNNQFNDFIDELSKNLDIDKIPKLTLSEYYLELMNRYRIQSFLKPLENKKLNIRDDSELEYNVVRIIYSNAFAYKLKVEIKELKNSKSKNKYNVKQSLVFKTLINQTLRYFIDFNIDFSIYYQATLYAQVLALYAYYGELRNSDFYLCIDEGQDISISQYKLLSEVNGKRVVFNIFGDLHQKLTGEIGIGEWKKLNDFIDGKIFTLNENYRNSSNIIKFYNTILKTDNKDFGIDTKEVELVPLDKFKEKVMLQLILRNRTAIIYNEKNDIEQEIKELCTSDILSREKAVLLTVREARGLEYDSVFVIDNHMTMQEKYISYTRALSELYIVK